MNISFLIWEMQQSNWENCTRCPTVLQWHLLNTLKTFYCLKII